MFSDYIMQINQLNNSLDIDRYVHYVVWDTLDDARRKIRTHLLRMFSSRHSSQAANHGPLALRDSGSTISFAMLPIICALACWRQTLLVKVLGVDRIGTSPNSS